MAPARPTPSPDPAALRETLQATWRRRRGGAVGIRSVTTHRTTSSRTKGSAVLKVEPVTGPVEYVFLKEFDAGGSSKPVRQRFRREESLYRDFFPRVALGMAAYYGSLADERQQRYWLLLEPVLHPPLAAGTRDHWLDAARWLARLQAGFGRQAAGTLLRDLVRPHTAADLANHVSRIRQSMVRHAPHWLARLGPVLDGYQRVATAILSLPPRFVHGSFNPKSHVLLDTTAVPPRLCPVDWEVAALSCPLYDLAELVEGLAPEAAPAFLEAYLDESVRCGEPPRAPAAWREAYTACRLHQVLRIVRRACKYQWPADQQADLVARAEALWRAP